MKSTQKDRDEVKTYWKAMSLSKYEHEKEIAQKYVNIIDDLEEMIGRYKLLYTAICEFSNGCGLSPGQHMELLEIAKLFYLNEIME